MTLRSVNSIAPMPLWTVLGTLLTAGGALTTSLQAQSLFENQPTVLATQWQPAPGLGGDLFANVPFGDAHQSDIGTTLFGSRLAGVFVTPQNDEALFHGTGPNDLAVLIREGDPIPGLAGVTLGDASGASFGDYHMAADGSLLVACRLSGAGVDPSNDSAVLAGQPGALSVLLREGDPAPGLPGVLYASDFYDESFDSVSRLPVQNRNGVVVFRSVLSGAVDPANDGAIFYGTAGALQLVAREGDTLLNGHVIQGFLPSLELNDAGQALIELVFSQTLGNPVTDDDDRALFRFTAGIGLELLAREGMTVPGTGGATLNNFSFLSWIPNLLGSSFSQDGQVLFSSPLAGGDVVPGQPNEAVCAASATGIVVIARPGNPAVGTAGTYGDLGFVQSFDDAGRVAFTARIEGDPAGLAGDTGLWVGTPAALALVARTGDPAPGTNGATLLPGTNFIMSINPQGQCLFLCSLAGGDANPASDRALYAWDPGLGLILVAREGDSIEVAPGDDRTLEIALWAWLPNGSVTALGHASDGTVATNARMVDSSESIVILNVPHLEVPFVYCAPKTSSGGCVTTIGTSAPLAQPISGMNDYAVTATAVQEGKNGLVFASLSGAAALPFSGGTLCVNPPTKRGPVLGSGGDDPTECDGSYATIVNDGAVIPFGLEASPGSSAWYQYWYRDPQNGAGALGTALSNAVRLDF